jgi:hypothetical protein
MSLLAKQVPYRSASPPSDPWRKALGYRHFSIPWAYAQFFELLVEPAGFEPATSALPERRSSRLSYGPERITGEGFAPAGWQVATRL